MFHNFLYVEYPALPKLPTNVVYGIGFIGSSKRVTVCTEYVNPNDDDSLIAKKVSFLQQATKRRHLQIGVSNKGLN